MYTMVNSKNIVILGGGPAGSAAGALLAKKGHRVALFHLPKRPEIIVGESLLPAIIPLLQALGVEEEIRSFSTYKPGATVVLDDDNRASFDFTLAKTKNTYAYNVPRSEFDQAILNAAVRGGVKVIHQKAELDANSDDQSVKLSLGSMKALEGYFDSDVDLIIDATGRQRLIPKKLALQSVEGARKDLALFAHLTDVELMSKGNIHVDRLTKGWAWRIPLPGRVSVGIVLSPDHISQFGNTREEQYDNFIKEEPRLKDLVVGSKRCSSVMTYTNYQWKSSQLYGPGWALIGDTGGFIDPVFSTGLFLAMDSAFKFCEAFEKGSDIALSSYQKEWQSELKAWQSIIDSWYDGKLLTLFKMGRTKRNTIIGRLINRHMTKHVTRIFTGEINSGSYSYKLLEFMNKYAINGHEPEMYKIR